MSETANPFGKCPCGGRYESREVELNINVEGEVCRVLDVPQGVCPNCASRVFKAEVMERLESIVRGARVDRRLSRRPVPI